MAKVSMKARKEVLNKHETKYRKARKKEKSKILDVVCGSTGLSRDRAAPAVSLQSLETLDIHAVTKDPDK